MDFPTLTNVMPVMSGKKLYEYFWELKGVCFTVSIIFVVHKLPSFMIDKKNITSARIHELRFEPM